MTEIITKVSVLTCAVVEYDGTAESLIEIATTIDREVRVRSTGNVVLSGAEQHPLRPGAVLARLPQIGLWMGSWEELEAMGWKRGPTP